MMPSYRRQVFGTALSSGLLCAVSLSAAPIELRCSWGPPDRNYSSALNAAVADAAKAYDANHPLRFNIDAERRTVELASELDRAVLGYGGVLSLDDSLRIEFQPERMQQPGWRWEDQRMVPQPSLVSVLLITINRYDLTSIMSLETRNHPEPMAVRWWRRGTCVTPRF